MPPLRAGDLKERIVFVQPTRVGDRGFATTTYMPVFAAWANAQLRGGQGEQTQDRGYAKIAVDFQVRYRSDITNDMKVVWRGMTFEIANPLQPFPLEGRLTIPCLQESFPLAVDHITITPSALFLAVSETQQLTTTLYDEDGNVLAGGFVSWSSSNLSIISVDLNGLATAHALGSCTITATCEGKSATAAALVVLPLSPGLDFAPVLRVSDIIAPLVYPAGENPTGKPLGVPIWDGGNKYRIAYPVGDGTWGQVISRFDIFGQAATGGTSNGAIRTGNAGVGPWPASHLDEIQLPAGQTNAKVQLNDAQALQAGDSQDATDYIRSYVAALVAKVAGSVGHTVHKILEDQRTFTNSENKLVTVPSVMTVFSDNYASDDERAHTHYFLQSDNDGTSIDLLAAGFANMPHRTRPRTQELLSPGPWHQAYGMLAQNSHTNCWWPSDSPTVQNGSISSSAVPTPDAADYYSAPTYKQITAFFHATVITTPSYEQVFKTVSLVNYAPDFIWLHYKHKPLSGQSCPADGVFTANLVESTGVNTYGPVGMNADDYCPKPMRDADGGRDYWARVPVNTPHVNIVSATVVGGNLVVVTDNTHGLNANDPVCLENLTNGAANGIFTVSSVQSNLQFTINGLAPTGGPFTSGNVRHGYTSFAPQIRNEGPDLTFYGTRFAMIAEGSGDSRNTGWHDAWVPRKTITGPASADPAWPVIWGPSLFMTRTEFWFIIRQMWPFAIGDMLRLGIGKRDFFQCGPAGTGDVPLAGGVLPGLHSPTTINLQFTSRWPDNPALQGWAAQCDITAGSDRFPRFCPFDLVLGAKQDPLTGVTTLQDFGIGMGPGTGITWYGNGDAFFGGTWAIDATAGTAWEYNITTDRHLGLMSDLDITGMSGGWLQAVMGGNSLPSDFRNMAARQIQKVWGARIDYMAA